MAKLFTGPFIILSGIVHKSDSRCNGKCNIVLTNVYACIYIQMCGK